MFRAERSEPPIWLPLSDCFPPLVFSSLVRIQNMEKQLVAIEKRDQEVTKREEQLATKTAALETWEKVRKEGEGGQRCREEEGEEREQLAHPRSLVPLPPSHNITSIRLISVSPYLVSSHALAPLPSPPFRSSRRVSGSTPTSGGSWRRPRRPRSGLRGGRRSCEGPRAN